MLARVGAIAVIVFLIGCAHLPVNPSFAMSREQAKRQIRAMEASPIQFQRPVVVLGGYHDPGLGAAVVCQRLRKFAGGQQVIGVSYFFARSFDECRQAVIDEVERVCPSDDPTQTIEVDVIGLSMGGVVGRYCAIDKPGAKRLRVHRMYTVSSPHRGAEHASEIPAMTQLHRDLCEKSGFLRELEKSEGSDRGYEIVPYVRRGDWIVGERDAAPWGQQALWVSTPPMEDSHIGAPLDPRIFGDIVRRLRGNPVRP